MMLIFFSILSTPFIYYPRSRPSRGIVSPLNSSINGFEITPEWHVVESNLLSKKNVRPDIVTKFYTPALGVFCITQPIPFYLTLESSAVSLAAFLPFSPTASTSGSRKVMRVQLMRQTTVDIRYAQVTFSYLFAHNFNTRGTGRLKKSRLTSGELTRLAMALLHLSSVNLISRI
jgi:hypothetical protein